LLSSLYVPFGPLESTSVSKWGVENSRQNAKADFNGDRFDHIGSRHGLFGEARRRKLLQTAAIRQRERGSSRTATGFINAFSPQEA
jgi:hypothetical protein